MGRQRINLSAVDFSQQMLISCHAAQLPVPVCSGLNTPLFPVQLEKTGIRGDDFCDHRSSCHATPAVRAAFMISQIYLVRVADAFHQAPFIIRALGRHLMPGATAVRTYQLNQTLAQQANEQLRVGSSWPAPPPSQDVRGC